MSNDSGELKTLGAVWSWVDLDLFNGKVKFVPKVFLCEKLKTVDFSDTIAASDLKVDLKTN